tara:strand:- start:4365 stop:4664 length:300 start_codon:yes stop_codon:yes gene_type:complete
LQNDYKNNTIYPFINDFFELQRTINIKRKIATFWSYNILLHYPLNKENLTLEYENFQTLTAKNVAYQQEAIELRSQIKNFFSGSARSRIKKNTSIYKVH